MILQIKTKGIVHVIGPEAGIDPAATDHCLRGLSCTATHGAFRSTGLGVWHRHLRGDGTCFS